MIPPIDAMICDIVKAFGFELQIRPSMNISGGYIVIAMHTDSLTYCAESEELEVAMAEVWTCVCG